MTITGGLDIVQRLLTDKPSFHLRGEARWGAFPKRLAIRRYARRGDSTIEAGVGSSTVFAASGANHTATNPEAAEHQRVRASGTRDCVASTVKRLV
jgi:hypothetical protein